MVILYRLPSPKYVQEHWRELTTNSNLFYLVYSRPLFLYFSLSTGSLHMLCIKLCLWLDSSWRWKQAFCQLSQLATTTALKFQNLKLKLRKPKSVSAASLFGCFQCARASDDHRNAFEVVRIINDQNNGSTSSSSMIMQLIWPRHFTPRKRRTWKRISVTRLGDLLDFVQLFKAFGNNIFAQI